MQCAVRRCDDTQTSFFLLAIFFLATVLSIFCLLIIDVDAEPYVVQSARAVKKAHNVTCFYSLNFTTRRYLFLQNDKLGKSVNTQSFFDSKFKSITQSTFRTWPAATNALLCRKFLLEIETFSIFARIWQH